MCCLSQMQLPHSRWPGITAGYLSNLSVQRANSTVHVPQVLWLCSQTLFCYSHRQTIRPATGNAEPQADFESQSTGSFNDGSAAEAERSAQSQVSSQALPDEDLMAVAEERLMQAEQRALRAEEATQVCALSGTVSGSEPHVLHEAFA